MSESTDSPTKSHEESKVAFLDTMIFLHFQLFDQLDWPTILNSKKVTIIIPPITIRELNKHKDAHNLSKIRKRADTVIGKLHDLFKDSNQAEVRHGVDIKYEIAEPKIDFDAQKLDSKWGDDYLLATIIFFKDEHPKANIIVITDDLNLTLKSRQYGIETLRLPNSYRLPNELDVNEKRIKELEKTVRELENQFPVLKCGFENGSNLMSFTLIKPMKTTEVSIEQTIERLKQEYPKAMVPPANPVDPNKLRQGIGVAELVEAFHTDKDGYTVEERRSYNRKLDKFFFDYKDYLNKMVKYNDIQTRTIELNIFVYNDGTAPGEDIDIYMHFPDGFKLSTKNVKHPAKPNPPKLQTVQEQMQERIRDPYINTSTILGRISDIARSSEQPNLSRPNIRRTKSYEVDFKLRKLKHNQPIHLDSFYITFDSFESANSFGIEYRINAGNVPREVAGFLNVIIKKDCEPNPK